MAQAILNDLSIEGISAYLPETRFELRNLAGIYGRDETEKIIRATEIERVRVAAPGETAADMCFAAASFLLERTGTSAENVDGIIFVSQTPDVLMPETSYFLQSKLGLGRTTLCRDIRLGCSGYVHGLFQAGLWVSCGACRRVLLLAGDTSTRIVNPRDRALRMIFGDAGTATLVTSGTGKIAFDFGSDGYEAKQLFVPAGGFRQPVSEKTKILETDEDGNARTQEDLFMNGMEVFRFALTRVPASIRTALELAGWKKDDVSVFAFHQGNGFVTKTLRKVLRLRDELAPSCVRETGNTGPASVPLLLSGLFGSENGLPSPKLVHALLCGFGAGLSWASAATDAFRNTRVFSPLNA
ncbi:MAG: 3-oxoacyl-ACP synthase III family protein [Candidatus Spyradosoma sp.]